MEWRATLRRDGGIQDNSELYTQLEEVSGTVECKAGERYCELRITLVQDEVCTVCGTYSSYDITKDKAENEINQSIITY